MNPIRFPIENPRSVGVPAHRSRSTAVRRSRRLLVALLSFTALQGAFAPSASATPPAVVPGFPYNQTLVPGRLYFKSVGLGRTGDIAYHNGIIYQSNVTGNPKRIWKFSDPTDITSLTKVMEASIALGNNNTIPGWQAFDTHGHTKIGDYLGRDIKRSSAGVNTLFPNDFPLADRFNQPTPASAIGDRADDHGLYWPWRLPFQWAQYGSTNGRGWIYRANEGPNPNAGANYRPAWEWDLLGESGVVGNSILIGNILICTSDESARGVVTYDIGPLFNNPPEPPKLLSKLSGSFGAYAASLWRNYIVLPRRDTNTIDVIDYSDPTNLRFVTSINVRGQVDANNNSVRSFSSNVPYMQAQDEFVFARRHKINMETLTPVLELDEVGNNRPAGSVTGPLETSQYMMPLGNLLITGSYSVGNSGDGIGVWAHQGPPDTRAPFVAYHIPRNQQTNYPVGAPITLLIHETLESYTIINKDTVIVRPIGGQPIEAWVSFSQDDHLTITPKTYLSPNTEYEVEIPAGGIKDASGNGITAYKFTFSTGSSIAGNRAPTIGGMTINPAPVAPGAAATISVNATDPEGDPLSYYFSYGDGTAPSGWVNTSSVSHTFPTAGHYDVTVQVRDTKPDNSQSISSKIIVATVLTPPPAGAQPTRSSTIALGANRKIWSVNPDHDTITGINADSKAKTDEFDLRAILGVSTPVKPRSVATDSGGNLWIACEDLDRVVVLSPSGVLQRTIRTGYGSAPIAVAPANDGTRMFVTLTGCGATDSGGVLTRYTATDPSNGWLVRYNTSTGAETGRLELGPTPRSIAVTANSARVLVTRFISADQYGEIYDVNASNATSLSWRAATRTIKLVKDPGDNSQDKDTAFLGRGVPNFLRSITISPDGTEAWYTASKMNVEHGTFFDQQTGTNGPLTHESTVRSIVGRIDLSTNLERTVTAGFGNSRIDVDNSDSPSSVTFSPNGDYAFVTLQGNNIVAVFDRLLINAGGAKNSVSRLSTGLAPQGGVIDPTTNRLFTMNFTGRNVGVIDLGEFFARGDRNVPNIRVAATASEPLSQEVLRGKKVFYNASDDSGLSDLTTVGFEGYISCATCHADDGQDGRTWDFTQRGEGLRNTIDLRGRNGVGHGNVHWTANFNEIADFLIDIHNEFGGTGFLPAGQTPNAPLGTSNANRHPDIDALAQYVSSLSLRTLPKSPHRNADGTLTANAITGRGVFTAQQCATCHVPEKFFVDSDNSTVSLRNVGTIRTSSGKRLTTETLTGIDTPTLLSAWATSPYFHDGSAETLESVFTVVGGTVYQAESGTLAAGASIPGDDTYRKDWNKVGHGRLVALFSNGSSTTLTGISGGAGGTGAVEVRYGATAQGVLRLTVNGTNYDTTVPANIAPRELRRVRIEGVALTSGTTNTITLSSPNGTDIYVDDFTVSTPGDLAAGASHRRMLGRPAAEQTSLLAYLRQLDGREDDGTLPAIEFVLTGADRILQDNDDNGLGDGLPTNAQTTNMIGHWNSGVRAMGLSFRIPPDLDPAKITGADFVVRLNKKVNIGTTDPKIDLIGIRGSATASFVNADFETAGTLIGDDYFTSSTVAGANGVLTTAGKTALVQWLRANATPGSYVFFRLKGDTSGTWGGQWDRYEGDNATSTAAPTLAITVDP